MRKVYRLQRKWREHWRLRDHFPWLTIENEAPVGLFV